MFKKLVFQLSLIFVLLCFGATMFSIAATPITLVGCSGDLGGGWYVMLGGIAGLIKNEAPEITIKVLPGAAGINPTKIDRNEAQIGLGVFPFDAMAIKGEGEMYEEPAKHLRGIGGDFRSVVINFLTYEDYEADSFDEIIKNKLPVRIVTQPKGGTEEFILQKILESYGLTYSDLESWGAKIFFVGAQDAKNKFKDKQVDMYIVSAAPPAAIIEEIKAGGRNLKLLPISEKVLNSLAEKGFKTGKDALIEKEYYDFLEEDVPTVVFGTEILVNESVPDEVVYKITKILCENKDKLLKIHQSLKVWDPEKGWKNLFVPLHPGAEKYYREAGYLK